jgi:hypothetical protein
VEASHCQLPSRFFSKVLVDSPRLSSLRISMLSILPVLLTLSAWAYGLGAVGPRVLARPAVLRSAPLMRVEQHEKAEEDDDEELAQQAMALGAARRSEKSVRAARAVAMAAVEALKADFVAGAFTPPTGKAPKDRLYKALKKPKGALTLIGPHAGVPLRPAPAPRAERSARARVSASRSAQRRRPHARAAEATSQPRRLAATRPGPSHMQARVSRSPLFPSAATT